MRLFTLTAVLAALTLATAVPAARADGPYEPNETALGAFGPVTTGLLAGALETPQDEDWFVLYPAADRQVGVLATIKGQCAQDSGNIEIELLDADASSPAMGVARIGHKNFQPTTSDRVAFTAVRGHRYFLRITQSGCENVPFTPSTGRMGMPGTGISCRKR